ncbi:MAG: GDP-mannose 4,6-dehydratase, partial [Pseudomonadota bacterium]|nr:GDP-mannose 4,6-dehydratase [Pseudomonadota bacterium]
NVHSVIKKESPDIIFHLAAQPLVSESYKQPFNTLTININGTLNLLEIISKYYSDIPLVIITSDKVYKNNNESKFFDEDSDIYGSCPYSTSKAVCEMIAHSYYNISKNISIRTARAGNVLGGGDWSENRIIPDLVRSYMSKKSAIIRNPKSIRPWSYVLDIIIGYLIIGLDCIEKKPSFNSYNLSPLQKSSFTVLDLANKFLNKFDKRNPVVVDDLVEFKEKKFLKLSSNKIFKELNWSNQISFEDTVKLTAQWYQEVLSGLSPLKVTENNIKDYLQILNTKEKIYAS